ncbi:hypothetical protein CP8484711_0679B, partial [Chlamydia psittaci 84-8471/1]
VNVNKISGSKKKSMNSCEPFP